MKYQFLYLKTWFLLKRKYFLNKISPNHIGYTKFAIVCSPRTGSTLLHTYLNSHTSIISYGEILRRNIEQEMLIDLQKKVFKPVGENIRAIGLKVFIGYKYLRDYQSYYEEIVGDESIKIIFLSRENIDKQYKSLKRAEITGYWSAEKNRNKTVEIPVDTEVLKEFKLDLMEQSKVALNDFKNHELMELTYEQLTKSKEKTLHQIQEFLQVKPQALWTVLRRQSKN
jgi:LPS sulfotransferase NodH